MYTLIIDQPDGCITQKLTREYPRFKDGDYWFNRVVELGMPSVALWQTSEDPELLKFHVALERNTNE